MSEPSNDLTVRILARATELIKKEDAWIRDDFFGCKEVPVSRADAEIGVTAIYAKDIDQYCALGAVYRAASEITEEPLDLLDSYAAQPWYPACVPAIERLAKVIEPNATSSLEEVVFNYNDEEATHEDIVNVFCTALKEELKDGTPSE